MLPAWLDRVGAALGGRLRHGPRVALALCLGAAVAQAHVSLPGSKRPSELEQRVLELGEAGSRPAAMAALFAAGQPAVPLLVRAAQGDDARSLPALAVLAELGPVARSGYPALVRLAQGTSSLARAAGHAAAAIGERDSVVFADWGGNRIVELDAKGQLQREVAVKGPWCVQVVAGERLLVCCFADRVVREIDWEGNEVASSPWPQGPIWARRGLDGSMFVSELEHVTHVGADGKVLGKLPYGARSLRVLWDDHLLLLDNSDCRLREVTPTGQLVREFKLGAQPMAFDRLASGRLRVLYQNRVTELEDDGTERDLEVAGAYVGYALASLRDGTWFLGENGKLTLRAPAGEVLWQFDCKSASCVVPRIDVRDAR